MKTAILVVGLLVLATLAIGGTILATGTLTAGVNGAAVTAVPEAGEAHLCDIGDPDCPCKPPRCIP